MLTKDDLQHIRTVIKEEVRPIVKDEIQGQLKKSLRGMVRKKDLKAMESRLVKKNNSVLANCDGRLISHDNRLTRVETHLHLPSLSA